MKKLILSSICCLFLCVSYGQTVPQGMKYQAVARDHSGEIIANQKISMQVKLQSDIEDLKVHYREIHQIVTNQFGLFTLVVGEGEVIEGDFRQVPWSTKNIWMEVAIREGSNKGFVTISNSKLLTVPYAFHAATADELTSNPFIPNGGGMGNGVDAPVGNGNGNGNNGPGVPSNVWSLFGNSNTNSGSDQLGTTDAEDLVMITNNIERLRITSDGNIDITNDLNIGNNVDIGNDLHVGNDAMIDYDVELNVDGGSTKNYGDFSVENMSSTYLSGTLTVDKETDLNSDLNVNNMSPTYLSGELTVVKNADFESSVNVGEDLTVYGNSDFIGSVDMSSTLEVDGETDLNNTFNVNNSSSSNLSGDLNVEGVSNFNNRMTINASVSGQQTDQTSYPVLIKGSEQGLAIEVNSATSNNLESGRGNNYISFWEKMNNGDVEQQGRIEGMNLADLDPTGLVSVVSGFISSPPSGLGMSDYSFGSFSLPTPNVNIGTKEVGIGDPINIEFDVIDPSSTSVTFDNGSFSNPFNSIDGTLSGITNEPTGGPASTIWNNLIKPALNTSGVFDNNPNFESQIFSNYTLDILNGTVSTLGEIVTFATSLASIFDPEDIFSEAVGLVVEIINLIIYGSYADINLGVAYESGSGDYAEWLERADSNEVINPGDVVGVIGGEISKELMHADRFMVVSTSPIVLGNMPGDAAGEHLSEKVAFMGQVPVKVRGQVNVGDYILPSGEGDGTGIAVAPDKMLARDYQRIIGVAWENSEPGNFINMIHTAVGVNHNDMSKVIEDMQHTMNAMQQAIKEINPNYEVRMYNVDQPAYSQPKQSLDYSVASSHQSQSTDYFDGKTYNSRKEMLQDVKRAMVEEAGINFDKVPLVEYMLDHPEQSEEIAAYYNKLLGDMMWITDQVNEASKKYRAR